MPQLKIKLQPGFVDLPDSDLAADKALTDDILVKISQNSKFSTVRCEYIFMGFYVNGDTIPVPVSPVDGYAYSREELLFDFTLYTTRAPAAGFVSGQADPPAISANQPANLLFYTNDIDDATGVVTIVTAYYFQGGAQTDTNNGILKVFAVCQRESVNTSS